MRVRVRVRVRIRVRVRVRRLHVRLGLDGAISARRDEISAELGLDHGEELGRPRVQRVAQRGAHLLRLRVRARVRVRLGLGAARSAAWGTPAQG